MASPMPPMPPDAMPPDAMPADAGMAPMPADAGMAPMPGPADQQMMPEPTIEDVRAADAERQRATLDTILASIPDPEEPYKMKTVGQVVKQLNSFVNVLNEALVDLGAPEGAGLPELELDFEAIAAAQGVTISGGEWNGRLPPELYIPMAATSEAVKATAPNEADKYRLDTTLLVNNELLRNYAGELKRMSKDEPLLEALTTQAVGMPNPNAMPELPPEAADMQMDEMGMAPPDQDLMAAV